MVVCGLFFQAVCVSGYLLTRSCGSESHQLIICCAEVLGGGGGWWLYPESTADQFHYIALPRIFKLWEREEKLSLPTPGTKILDLYHVSLLN